MKDLRSEALARGAKEKQLDSQIFGIVETAVAECAVSEVGTAKAMVDRLKDEVSIMRDMVGQASNKARTAERDVRLLMEKVSQIDVDASQLVIESKEAKDALLVYRGVLETTLDVFGDLPESVMEKTVEAASYAMWRAIMGPKFEQQDKQRRVI